MEITEQEECQLVPEQQGKLNETVSPNRNIFFGDRPQIAPRIDN